MLKNLNDEEESSKFLHLQAPPHDHEHVHHHPCVFYACFHHRIHAKHAT